MKGQTLIEVLISLTIAVIVITSITATVLISLTNAQSAKNQDTAAQLSQEGMEIAQQNPDMAEGTYCLGTSLLLTAGSGLDSTGQCPANVGPSVPYLFKRTVYYNKTPPNNCPSPTIAGSSITFTRVTVVTSWADAHCATAFCKQSKEVSCL